MPSKKKIIYSFLALLALSGLGVALVYLPKTQVLKQRAAPASGTATLSFNLLGISNNVASIQIYSNKQVDSFRLFVKPITGKAQIASGQVIGASPSNFASLVNTVLSDGTLTIGGYVPKTSALPTAPVHLANFNVNLLSGWQSEEIGFIKNAQFELALEGADYILGTPNTIVLTTLTKTPTPTASPTATPTVYVCGQSNCPGCCNENICRAGNTPQFCGLGGNSCQACSLPFNACVNNACAIQRAEGPEVAFVYPTTNSGLIDTTPDVIFSLSPLDSTLYPMDLLVGIYSHVTGAVCSTGWLPGEIKVTDRGKTVTANRFYKMSGTSLLNLPCNLEIGRSYYFAIQLRLRKDEKVTPAVIADNVKVYSRDEARNMINSSLVSSLSVLTGSMVGTTGVFTYKMEVTNNTPFYFSDVVVAQLPPGDSLPVRNGTTPPPDDVTGPELMWVLRAMPPGSTRSIISSYKVNAGVCDKDISIPAFMVQVSSGGESFTKNSSEGFVWAYCTATPPTATSTPAVWPTATSTPSPIPTAPAGFPITRQLTGDISVCPGKIFKVNLILNNMGVGVTSADLKMPIPLRITFERISFPLDTGLAADLTVPNTITIKDSNSGLSLPSGSTRIDLEFKAKDDASGSITFEPYSIKVGTAKGYSNTHTLNVKSPAQCGVTACPRGDLGNLDCSANGAVGVQDLDILIRCWGTGCITNPSSRPTNAKRSPDIVVVPSTSNNKVDIYDLDKLIRCWGTACL